MGGFVDAVGVAAGAGGPTGAVGRATGAGTTAFAFLGLLGGCWMASLGNNDLLSFLAGGGSTDDWAGGEGLGGTVAAGVALAVRFVLVGDLTKDGMGGELST